MLLILIGKSGSGKSTLEKYLDNKGYYKKVIVATTRPKRHDELDGVDYYFYNDRDFINATSNQEFIETEVYNNWNYGVLKRSIHPNENQVLIMTPSAMEHFKPYAKAKNILYKTVYLDVDDDTRMMASYTSRVDKDEVHARFLRDRINHEGAKNKCNLVITNHHFQYSPEEITEMIKSSLSSI